MRIRPKGSFTVRKAERWVLGQKYLKFSPEKSSDAFTGPATTKLTDASF